MRATTASLTFTGIATITLALMPASITAQARGGHGGGGGFHGGGSHASAPSGGGRSFGGGSSYRAAPTPPSHSGSRSYARPESNRLSGAARIPQSGYASGHMPNSSAASTASGGFVTADGTAPAHPNTPQANFETRFPRVENTDVRVRTFVGQGNELVEELPRTVATPAVPPATGQTAITAPKRPARGTAMFGSAPLLFNQRAPFVNFGLGYGFDLGWDSCWGAAWALDPACLYSFGPVYGLYGSPDYDSSTYPAPPDAGYDQNNPPAEAPTPEDNTPEQPAVPLNPNWDSTINAPSAGATAGSAVVIYFRNGTEIKPSDYWFSGDKLHYIAGGQETAVDIESVDLQRTNRENQKNGVQFWLKSGPDQIPGLTAPQATPQSAPAVPPSDSVPRPSFVPQSSVLTPTA